MKKTNKPRDLERTVQRAIVQRLGLLGITLYRRNVGGFTDDYGHRVRFAKRGQSDLWGIDNTLYRHWEVETKREGEKPTPAQLAWIKEMTMRGAIAFWTDSADVAARVAEAVLQGGRIIWLEGPDFDIEMPDSPLSPE